MQRNPASSQPAASPTGSPAFGGPLPALFNHPFAGAAIILVLLVVIASWGGVPQASADLFWIGVGVLVLLLGGWIALGWHLLFRPLPAGHRLPDARPLHPLIRQGGAVVIGLSAIALIVGAAWDEVWHRKYGIPFGEDFFWLPHLMIYFGVVVALLAGITGFARVWRTGKGTLQQRFRANRLAALMLLTSLLMIYVLPSDPLWHLIYGQDLGALSLPHVMLLVGFEAAGLLAVALHFSMQPLRTWAGPLALRLSDGLPLLLLSFGLTELLQLLTTDWDGMARVSPQVLSRPEWLLPVCIMLAAGFVGVLANHALRRVGAATALGLIAFAARAVLISLFNFPEMSSDAWLLAIAPLVTLDVMSLLWLRMIRTPPPFWFAGLAGAAGMIFALPLMNRLFIYPQITQSTLVVTALAVVLTAVLLAIPARQMGDYLASLRQPSAVLQAEQAATPLLRRMPVIAVGSVLVLLALLVVIIMTAPPPV